MAIERFEQLKVWQDAHALVLATYRATASFPDDERYGLSSQMRRAAVSVPANIAEGFKRRSNRDKGHFYNVAQASLEELRYYLLLARDLGYHLDVVTLSAAADGVAKMLHRLVQVVGGSEPGSARRREPGA